MNLVGIARACAVECERQQVGVEGVVALLHAYQYALAQGGVPPDEFDMRELARVIEPSTRGRYRTTPVIFKEGGSAAPPGTVGEGIARLFERLDGEVAAEEFLRALLSIHPFTDGNGRVGFVLFNWLRGTLEDPVPLPEFSW